ncbi:MAG: T9SS type A sorting domain-containing protein [bacterium]|nr:T9SS type A sorting domain-containing protein [bacterium]
MTCKYTLVTLTGFSLEPLPRWKVRIRSNSIHNTFPCVLTFNAAATVCPYPVPYKSCGTNGQYPGTADNIMGSDENDIYAPSEHCNATAYLSNKPEAGRGTPKNQVQSPDWHAIEQQLQELSFEVFPNPARHQATLVLSNPVPEAEVVAYSLLGQELMRQSLRGQQVLQLEVGSWAIRHTAVVIAVFEPGQPPKTQKLLLAE